MKRVYDGIIGLIIGDALGVPVEFKSRQEIANNPVVILVNSCDWWFSNHEKRVTMGDDGDKGNRPDKALRHM